MQSKHPKQLCLVVCDLERGLRAHGVDIEKPFDLLAEHPSHYGEILQEGAWVTPLVHLQELCVPFMKYV